MGEHQGACPTTYDLGFVRRLNLSGLDLLPVNPSEESVVFDVPFSLGTAAQPLQRIFRQ